MKKTLIGGFAAITLYTIIPTLLGKLNLAGIYHKGNQPNTMALTFDDGPSPRFTPQLLDLLKHNQVKATFFVVGEKAEKYPEIVKRIHKEGHEIGVHHYKHISNWLLLPSAYKRNLTETIRAISEITGEKPVYYRPPWGHFNLFSYFCRENLQVIMWSHIPKDWKKGQEDVALYEKLQEAKGDGDIILLHDCGDTLGADREAPAVMLRTLEPFIKDMKEREIQFSTITRLLKKEI